MKFNDFEYDGIRLSDFGLIIVSFDGAQDDEITTDSQKTFNSVSLFGGRYQPFLTSVYDDRLEIEFSIAKNICENETNCYFTIAEIENIQYWLNRSTPHMFRILNDIEYADVYWEGSFNLEWIKAGENTVGLKATFISTRPYGIGSENLYTKELTSENDLKIADYSKDEGSIMPTVIITLREAGDLELTNTFSGTKTVTKIANCEEGEIITFTKMHQITTSSNTHDVYNDFNWVFPCIYNLFGEIMNVFTSNLNCKCVVAYNPIRKVTFS